ncbi:Alg9-like mannosyltransferase family-domain-containing protein [Phakopsora pachyrhizi]|uniref:Mannosyltransferase n=1 Tax=Phakopsora pachyrhizi TaxID=170000 RepID=A0AAV0AZT5_PHAPC|nr:Alg9-like mannosyltransferase family-domain-containing protein [Phakopsora pachyrhizi]CAH7675922.1 Alg9-like mannosyltransferase family-domain-containing protein [Phakopsora pachyrhizi]
MSRPAVKPSLCYLVLVLIRLIILLTSTSFIHPDEHFQNTEIAISDVFGLINVTRSWEWSKPDISDANSQAFGGHAVRSIVPIYATSHLGLKLLKFFSELGVLNLSTRNLVTAPRLVLFLLSILLELLIFRVTRSFTAVLLLASSLSNLLFASRTFSNSLEYILLSSSILLSTRLYSGRFKLFSLVVWTFINIFAIWVRVSFLAFSIPIILGLSFSLIIKSYRYFTTAVIVSTLTVAVLVTVDSIYFGHWPSITPLRLLIYNLDRRNLAIHGTHPRWLHLLANGPIIFGPALWILGLGYILKHLKSIHRKTTIVQLSMVTFLSGTLLLSTQPHQEPRFLLPLALPLSIMVAKIINKMKPKFKKIFWSIHISYSIISVILFGYLHQGGLQPSLSRLNPELDLCISWITFDVPSTLIESGHMKVKNLRGATRDEFLKELHVFNERNIKNVWLLAPQWAIEEDIEKDLLELKWKSQTIHLDLDRLDSILKAGYSKSGMGIWKVNLNKLNSTRDI